MNELVSIWPVDGRFANVVWQVSDVCNYRCSYCNPGNWGGHHKNLALDTYLSVLDKIVDWFRGRGYRGFKMFFSGGEPSAWAPLVPICKFLREKVDRPLLAINTNLSRPLSFWQEHKTLFNDIVASYHVEFADREKYVEKVLFLQHHVSYLACRLLMHDERFAEVAELGRELEERLENGVVEYAPLFEELTPHAGMHEYADGWKRDFLASHSYFRKEGRPPVRDDAPHPAYCMELYADGSTRALNSNRLVAEGKNFFRGWKCWINDGIFINPMGEIRLASCNASRLVGNINEGRVEFLDEPVICPEERCNCGTDINIPKRKSA